MNILFDLHKPYVIPPVTAGLLNCVLVLWAYKEAAPGRVRKTFILWSLALGLWNLSIAVGYSLQDFHEAILWYRMGVTSIVRFLPVLFLQFVMAITSTWQEKKNQFIIRASYVVVSVFLIIGLTTPFLIKSVTSFYWGYYPVAGQGEMLFGIPFAAIVVYAFYLLYGAIQDSTGYRQNQMKYLFVGALICFGGGITNFLPFYGIQVYPLGNLLNSIYSLIVAYTIIEYELMDIRIMLRRGTVYVVLSGTLTLVYVSIVHTLQNIFGHYGLGEGLVFYTAAFPITVIMAPGMKAHIEPFVGRVAFWQAPHYAEALGDFSQAIFSLMDPKAVAHKTLEKAIRMLQLKGGALYLITKTPLFWEKVAATDACGPQTLTDNHPIVQSVRHGALEAIKEKMMWVYRHKPSTPEHVLRRKQLEEWPYALTIPLNERGHIMGFLALEEKISGEMFNDEDLRLLRGLSRPAATALRHTQRMADIEVHEKILKQQHDMMLMGVLATEMAHELSKPLTHIVNAGSRLGPVISLPERENLVKIERAAHHASEILESFVMLSPLMDLPREDVSLPAVVDEAIDFLGLNDDALVHIEKQYAPLPAVRIHRGQIGQVCANILQNAWQAMPAGGRLTIRLSHAVGGAHRGIIQLIVEDSGDGIPAHVLPHVFEPFFSTKKETGGRGVGLTLCRAMIERHGGTLVLESPIAQNRGTRVIIALPLETKGVSHVGKHT